MGSIAAAFMLMMGAGTVNAASATVSAAGCNTGYDRAFYPTAGANDLSGCPSENLILGTFKFPWNNYVDVATNFSTADYTKLQIGAGSVSTGAYAWYGPLYVYQDKSGGTTKLSDAFVCDGVRYTNKSISPFWTLGFGSTVITAEQYVWMTTTGSCDAQAVGHVYFSIKHWREEAATSMRVKSWIAGAASAAVLGLGFSLWHPWVAGAASLNRPQSVEAALAPSPETVTWQQARIDAPTLVRAPTWLPAGISQSQLVRDPSHGVVVATYTGPKQAWTILVQEIPGPTAVSNPNEVPGTLAGHPVTLAQWQASSGAQLHDVFFQLNGNGYDVLGINVPLPVVEHVATSVIAQ